MQVCSLRPEPASWSTMLSRPGCARGRAPARVGRLDDDCVVEPDDADQALVACTSVSRLSARRSRADAGVAVGVFSATCHTASQAPRSDQPASSGTMRMSKLAEPGHFSITA
jgi:hypothetical protein